MRTLSGTSPQPVPIQNPTPVKKAGAPRRLHKRAIPAETGNEIWLLTLSDLLMLLLIFFVLLFGLILQRQGQDAAPQPLPASPAAQAPAPEAQPSPPEALPASSPTEQAAASLESDLAVMFGDSQAEGGVTVERRTNAIVVTFPERIMFDSGLSQLKPTVHPLLEKVTAFIQGHRDVSVEIQGHTDDRPISNRRYPSNWELSADRASQVAKALVRQGIDPQRLSIRGFGEYRPLHANDNDQNRLKNRRVEIQFSLIPPQS